MQRMRRYMQNAMYHVAKFLYIGVLALFIHVAFSVWNIEAYAEDNDDKSSNVISEIDANKKIAEESDNDVDADDESENEDEDDDDNEDEGVAIKAMELFRRNESDMVLGDPKAPNVILEYSSFACGHCADFHERMFDKIKKEFIDTGKAYYILRDIGHGDAILAASTAAYCLGKKDSVERYYDFVDLLYKKQSTWIYSKRYRNVLKSMFTMYGVNAKDFEQCIDDVRTSNMLLRRSYDLNQVMDIIETPMLIINGVKVSELSIENIREVLK